MIELKVIGNLGSDAEIRTHNGESFVTFDIAHNTNYKNAEGVKCSKTTWVSCLFKNTNVAAYLKKGTQVYVSGTPEAKGFISKQDGSAGASLNLTVRNIELLSSNTPKPAAQAAGQQQQATKPAATAAAAAPNAAGKDDNLPF
jgi:single-strand DNA-binding protein